MVTVTRLFDSHTEALDAVTALEAAGVHHEKISIISSNTDNWHDGHAHKGRSEDKREGLLGDRNGDGVNDVAEGAGKGAAAGGLLGAGAGALAGLGMLAIPGLGPVVAAGWLASTAVGAIVGAAAGGTTGGLLGALKEAGHSDEEAHVYSEGVRRGGTLVSVKAEDSDRQRIEAMLDARRGHEASARGKAYREAGWLEYDPEAGPYSPEQASRERSLYSPY